MSDVGETVPSKISDPYGVLEDSTFPRAYKEYRIVDAFSVYAQSEEQALQRWQFFKDVLEQLSYNEWHQHELVTFVVPEGMRRPAGEPSIEVVEETWIVDPEQHYGGMASGMLAEWAWLNPEHDAEWDPGKLAYRIFHGQIDPEEEEMLAEQAKGFTF